MKTVIIGGVAGGASAAARLRRLDESAEIILLERGEYISFANCGLPYYVGGEITSRENLTVQTPESFHARFNVDVRVNSEAVSIDRTGKRVEVINRATGEKYVERYDKLILAPGAKPIVPRGVTLSQRVFTLRNIPDTVRIRQFVDANHPQTAAIIGGGAIGLEMAENLMRSGVNVTIADMADHLIAPMDADAAADVQNYVRKKGVELRLGSALEGIEEAEEGLTVRLSADEIKADMAILSIGVRPENDLAIMAGLKTGERGGIVVNSHMCTEDADIYAVGDAVEIIDFNTGAAAQVALAGPANRQGRIAADNICGIASEYEGTQGSSIIKVFDMTVALTGMNERTAQARGLDYDKVFLASPSHATYYPGANNIIMKVLFEKPDGRILGAQLTGMQGVDKRADVLATSIRLGATAHDLVKLELCYAPPYSSAKDPVNMAGFAIENLLRGLVKQIHWPQVAELPRDGSVTLLDVRTPAEIARGMVDGFKSIPLDELRARIGELDKTKPVYVHCQSGLRSYVACRLLSGFGFDCYNIGGGYRLYEATVKARREADRPCTTCGA